MAKPQTLPAAVVRLPTAAAERVRQPRSDCRWRLIRDGRKTGAVHRLERSPPERPSPENAEQAARRELFEAGGIVRNAPLVLIGAMMLSLTPEQREAMMGRLALMKAALPEPSTEAALAYAEHLLPVEQLISRTTTHEA